MTTLEIILITYICISQILAMVILIAWSKKHIKIGIPLFFILNPFGTITVFLMFYIQEKKENRK